MGDNNGDYLTAYRKFFENFPSTVNLADQMPVTIMVHKIEECEIGGLVFDWCQRYLNARDCPQGLIVPLNRAVLDEVHSLLKTDSHSCGLDENKCYDALTFSRIVIKKLIDVCARYSDNAVLSTLPPPQTDHLQVAFCGEKNLRPHMEDMHIVVHDLHALYNIQGYGQASFYAVYDGHQGTRAAQYCVTHLHHFLVRSEHYPEDPIRAFKDAFHRTNNLFLSKFRKGGTTAVCALYRPKESMLYVAWVGDSQAVLAASRHSYHLVRPHKPDLPEEREMIEAKGGAVLWFQGVWRVAGGLAVSRVIGDPMMKDYVTAEPEIRVVPLQGQEDFVILGSDGLWDHINKEAAVDIVYEYLLKYPESWEGACKALCEAAKEGDSEDNISALVVLLREGKDMDLEVRQRGPWEGQEFGPETDVDHPLLPDTPVESEGHDVAEESGESDEEWNYIKGSVNEENKENGGNDPTDMESQLNPNAAEFIPGVVSVEDDDVVLSCSPRKNNLKNLDNVVVPSEKEFTDDIASKPAELDDFSEKEMMKEVNESASEDVDVSTAAVCGDDSVLGLSLNGSTLLNGHKEDEDQDNPFLANADVNDVKVSPTSPVDFVSDHFGSGADRLGFMPFGEVSAPTEKFSNEPISLSAEISSHFNFIDSHLEESRDKKMEPELLPVIQESTSPFGNELSFNDILKSKSEFTEHQTKNNPFETEGFENGEAENNENIFTDKYYFEEKVEPAPDFNSECAGNIAEDTKLEVASEKEEDEEVSHPTFENNEFLSRDENEFEPDVVKAEKNEEDVKLESVVDEIEFHDKFENNDAEEVSHVKFSFENNQEVAFSSQELDIDEKVGTVDSIYNDHTITPQNIEEITAPVDKIEEDSRQNENIYKVDSDEELHDIKNGFIAPQHDIMTASFHESYNEQQTFDTFARHSEPKEDVEMVGDQQADELQLSFNDKENDVVTMVTTASEIDTDEPRLNENEEFCHIEENVVEPVQFNDEAEVTLPEGGVQSFIPLVDELTNVNDSQEESKLEAINGISHENCEEKEIMSEKELLIGDEKYFMDKDDRLSPAVEEAIVLNPTLIETPNLHDIDVNEIRTSEDDQISHISSVEEPQQVDLVSSFEVIQEVKPVSEETFFSVNGEILESHPLQPEEVADISSKNDMLIETGQEEELAPVAEEKEIPKCNGIHEVENNLKVEFADQASLGTAEEIAIVPAVLEEVKAVTEEAIPEIPTAPEEVKSTAAEEAISAVPEISSAAEAAVAAAAVTATVAAAAAGASVAVSKTATAKKPSTAATTKASATKSTTGPVKRAGAPLSKASSPATKPTSLGAKPPSKPTTPVGKATSPSSAKPKLPAQSSTTAKPTAPIRPPSAGALKSKTTTTAAKPAMGVPKSSAAPAKLTSAKAPVTASKPAAAKPAPTKPLAAKPAPRPASSVTAKPPTTVKAAPTPAAAKKVPAATKPAVSTTARPLSATAKTATAKTAPGSTTVRTVSAKPILSPTTKTAAPAATKPAPIKAKAPASTTAKPKTAAAPLKKTVVDKNAKNAVKNGVSAKKPVTKPAKAFEEDKEDEHAVSSTTNGLIEHIENGKIESPIVELHPEII